MSARGIWFEVWPAGWGFYHVKRCGVVVMGIAWGPITVATVFGRRRAIAKARSLEAPTFSTLADRGGAAARVAPPNSLDHLVAEPGPVPKDGTG